MDAIITIESRTGKTTLRRKAKQFDFSLVNRNERNALIRTMRETMRDANGVGLSANQIGVDAQLFVAEVPDSRGGKKFYAIFNPTIEKQSAEKTTEEEGCLSVPGTYGNVARSGRITLKGFDKEGKPLKIKAWGFLARVFQHEVDHLNGMLFVDRTKEIYEVPKSERLLKKRKMTND